MAGLEVKGHNLKGGTKNPRRYEFDVIAGEALATNDICYISDITAGRLKIKKAAGSAYLTSGGILLFAKHAIASGKHGRAAMIGTITGQNTLALSVQDPVYLGASGAISLTRLASGRVIGAVGVVSATVGEVVFNGLAIGSPPRILVSAPAASTAVTGATETQVDFSTATAIFAANVLKVGSSIKIRAWGLHTATTGAENHTIGIALGGTLIMVTGNLDPADNNVFDLEATILIRAIGASGTLHGIGSVRHGAPSAVAVANHTIATASGATSTVAIDTTASNTFSVFIDRQAAAADSDSCRLDGFLLIADI